MRDGPFGSVGDRDVAHAAYRDVFTAVPKGPSRSGGTVWHAGGSSDSYFKTAAIESATRSTLPWLMPAMLIRLDSTM